MPMKLPVRFDLPVVVQRAWVRCLGPGPEHKFYSDDPCRNRVCGKCAGHMIRASPRMTNVCRRDTGRRVRPPQEAT